MSSRCPNAALLLLLLGPVLSGGGCSPAPSARLTDEVLVVLSIDTLRADRLGCGGDPEARTPHLDQLARSGVQFPVAATSVPLTLPAHTTLFSGLEPPDHGVRNNGFFEVPEDVPLLAEAFSANGWSTAAFVASFPLARRFGLARGFDVYRDAGRVEADRALTLYAERPANVVNDDVELWLDERDAAKATFLWVHYFDPHAPYLPHAPVYRANRSDAYAGEVNFVDQQVARLLRALGDRFVTMRVCVTSDHGEGLGEHGENSHGIFVYESTVRVPLFFAGAGVPFGALGVEPAALVRVAPTLVKWVDVVTNPEHFPGESLLTSDGVPRRAAGGDLYLETRFPEFRLGWAPLRALRSSRWKVIHAPDPEIYDMERDPGELRNLYANTDVRGEVAGLLDDVRELRWDVRPLDRADVDERTAALLESLGYVGSAPESPSGGQDLPDPKSRIAITQHIDRATGQVAAGDLAGARLAIARALSIDSRHKEANILLGRVEAMSGNGIRALELFEYSLTLSPRELDEVAQFEIGNIALQSGDVAKAEAHFELAVLENPLNADAFFNWGVAAFYRRRMDDAHDRWSEVLRLDPDHRQAAEWLAKLEAGIATRPSNPSGTAP